MDRLEFVRNQLNFLTENVKDKIKAITDEVAARVTPIPTLSLTTVWYKNIYIYTYNIVKERIYLFLYIYIYKYILTFTIFSL